jgi:prevent-host-death family protein
MAKPQDGRWPFQLARNEFGVVVDQACQQGPQIVTRRGKDVAVVLSYDDYQALLKPRDSLAAFLRRSPLAGLELDLDRPREFGREVDL